MLKVKRKRNGRMDRDAGEGMGDALIVQPSSQSYRRGFYDSGVIASGLPVAQAKGTVLTDPHFSQPEGGGSLGGTAGTRKRGGLEEFGRGVGIGTRGIINGAANVAEPLRLGMNSINGLLGGDPSYFSPMGDRLADWFNLPKPETDMEKIIHSVNSATTSSMTGLGGANLLAKTASKTPLNFYPTMTRSPLPQKVPGGEGIAQQLAARPGTQLTGDMAGEVAAQMVQQAGGGPLVSTAAALAGSAIAGKIVAGKVTDGRSKKRQPSVRESMSDEGARYLLTTPDSKKTDVVRGTSFEDVKKVLYSDDRTIKVTYTQTGIDFSLIERKQLGEYLESLTKKNLKALKYENASSYVQYLQRLVSKFFPSRTGIRFRTRDGVIDYGHLVKDGLRQKYVHSLPQTLKNHDIRMEFTTKEGAEKAYLIKKYFDPEIQKDIWDMLVMHDRELTTKFVQRDKRGANYVMNKFEEVTTGGKHPSGKD